MAAKLEPAAATMAVVSRSARAAPESEGGRVGRRVSARAARAFAFGGTGSRVARGAEVGRAAAMGRARCCMAATETIQRARGVRLCARLGVHFLAYTVRIPNLAPVAKLLYSGWSTNLVKGSHPLGLWNNS